MMKDTLKSHYAQLLGLSNNWEVCGVKLELESKCVGIKVAHRSGVRVTCPDCGTRCTVADHAPERTWRHLDTMQFATEIRGRAPRSDCTKCGVKTTEVPWAGKRSRFTILFEPFAIEVLLMSRDVKGASDLLGLNWHSTQTIMKRAVDRGLLRREAEPVEYVGLDEKSFRRGQDYITA